MEEVELLQCCQQVELQLSAVWLLLVQEVLVMSRPPCGNTARPERLVSRRGVQML